MKLSLNHNEHLDTELNIIPIIDCFVMLICFLLFTAAFTQLVFVETKLTSNTANAANKSRSELDQFRLVITIKEEGFQLITTGGALREKTNISIPNSEGKYNYQMLHEKIIALKSLYPDRYSADIEVKVKHNDKISYNSVLETIDMVRHLSDDEYSILRIAQKKIHNIELSSPEGEKIIPTHIDVLAHNLLSNEVAKNTDQKVLFPDIALLGVD